jgi:hypothetical protein
MASIWDGIGLQNQVQRLAVPGITTTGTTQNPAKVPQKPMPSPYTPPPSPAPDPNRPITMGGGTTPYTPPPAPAPDPNRPITTSGAAVPGVGMASATGAPGTFTATNNLIGRQFTGAPTQSPGYQGVAGPDYSAAIAALNKSGGGPSFQFGGDTQQVRGMTLDQLQKTLEGTDRAKLAADAYGIMEERSRPEFDQRVRALGQKTAALGRIGSGIYGSNLTDLNTEREQELGFNRRELANSAAGQQLQDRLSQLDAARGVGDSFSGQDISAGQLNQQGARDAFNQKMSLFDALSGVADSRYGANVRERDTAYGAGRDQYGDAVNERGYQYGLERDAQDDRYRSRGFEEDLIDRQFDRDIRGRSFEEDLYNNQFNRGAQLYGLGKDKNLYNNLINQTNRYDKQSSEAGDAFADSMAGYGLKRPGTPAPTRSPSDDFYRTTGAYPEEALNIPTPDYRTTRY